ncbi:MAG: hypothetical protein ACRYGF_16760 [Janthinobacterium lividum]
MKMSPIVVTMAALIVHGTAQACVTCDSATACQVRRGIFDPHFFHTLLLVLAPFPVLLAAVAAVCFVLPIPRTEEA